MSLKIPFSLPDLEPRRELATIQLGLLQLQNQLKQNPSGFAETARSTVETLSFQFRSFETAAMAPQNSSLRHCYDSVQEAFIKIQEQLKHIPRSKSQSAVCFECVIL